MNPWYPNDPPITEEDEKEMRKIKNQRWTPLDKLCEYITQPTSTQVWLTSPEVTEFCRQAAEERKHEISNDNE